MQHYVALKTESDRLGLPERFTTDLTEHDKAMLETADPDLPFGWAVHADGTHLFWPGTQDGVGHTVDMFPRFVREAVEGCGPLHFYWWDGLGLEQIEERELRQRLIEATNG